MSPVIKLGSARDAKVVVSHTPALAHGATETTMAADPHREELARLYALLAERDTALEDLREEVKKARADGELAGRTAAERKAENSREKSLELLRLGIEQAIAAAADRQSQMEVLAVMIARTAVEKLFGNDCGRKAAVADLVERQLRPLERQMLMGVEVSPVDFSDNGELAALARQIGVAPGQISADADLAAGACRMKLRVGTLEVGLDQQWGTIRNLLDDLASATDS